MPTRRAALAGAVFLPFAARAGTDGADWTALAARWLAPLLAAVAALPGPG